ncbi:unnamed protein product, partial [Nesidiocoris tenuis]
MVGGDPDVSREFSSPTVTSYTESLAPRILMTSRFLTSASGHKSCRWSGFHENGSGAGLFRRSIFSRKTLVL